MYFWMNTYAFIHASGCKYSMPPSDIAFCAA
jgi:hypothetical protein